MEPKKAVALEYHRQQDIAPRIVAKGAGAVAQAIIQTAKDNDVVVVENSSLTDALMTLEVEQVIPEDLFLAVAEVLAYVYRIRHQKA
nr:flagellar biosynthesis protein FlhB [Bacilli bacterium]